jgi:type II restriction enzyme
MKKLVSKLESNFSFLDEPISLTKAKQELEIKKEIYNFYPKILLDEIGEGTESYDILKLPNLIDKYSNNENNENTDNFEDSLEQGFNTFYNVSAEKIGGPGNTDIKCIYLEDNSIFAVEAKSTKNKLSLVNDGRLKAHRIKIGAKYTIVITPRYVPAVLRDIQGTKSVIIKANTFSEYLYNSILEDERNINYAEIHHLVVDNLGEDISNQISDITMNKFAASGELYPDATN